MSILRADSIRDRAGTGAPNFPNGATVTGVITATSFSGSVTGNADTATSATLATNAQGLTGTPSIVVQDATVQGDLTVNGTTSTIDTVITAVDSLAVEGTVGIGTATAPTGSARLHVIRGGDIQILSECTATGTGANAGFRLKGADSNSDWYIQTGNVTSGGLRIYGGSSASEKLLINAAGTAIFKGGLAEKFNNKGTTLSASNVCAIADGNVILFTGNETLSNRTLNLTGIHSVLAVGESISVTAIITPNGTGNISTIDIDSVNNSANQVWSGGSAPSAGASGRDVYTFTIFKTGTGTTDYLIFGAATNYA